MKVEGPQTPRLNGVRRRGGVAGDGSFADALADTEASPTTAGVGAPTSAAPVSGLFALQATEAEPGDAAAERAKSRAEMILRQLDQLRLDLLAGGIPKPHLVALAQGVKTMRAQVFDPRLTDILDEIDLRAQVELAKYDPYKS